MIGALSSAFQDGSRYPMCALRPGITWHDLVQTTTSEGGAIRNSTGRAPGLPWVRWRLLLLGI